MHLKNSASPLAVDVITNGRDYMRSQIVEPTGGHEVSWYQRAEGGQWEHKRQALSDEDAVIMQQGFQAIIRGDRGAVPEKMFDIMGIERGQEVGLCQLTMYDKTKLGK